MFLFVVFVVSVICRRCRRRLVYRAVCLHDRPYARARYRTHQRAIKARKHTKFNTLKIKGIKSVHQHAMLNEIDCQRQNKKIKIEKKNNVANKYATCNEYIGIVLYKLSLELHTCAHAYIRIYTHTMVI